MLDDLFAKFNSRAMDVPTGTQVMAQNSDAGKSITVAADIIQKESAGLSKDYKQIVQTAKQELAEPTITAATTEYINRMLDIAKESLVEGNANLGHAMEFIST
jgi:hypothetical protein